MVGPRRTDVSTVVVRPIDTHPWRYAAF